MYCCTLAGEQDQSPQGRTARGLGTVEVTHKLRDNRPQQKPESYQEWSQAPGPVLPLSSLHLACKPTAHNQSNRETGGRGRSRKAEAQ